jgi:3-methyladenine DNA glycosylase AlkD
MTLEETMGALEAAGTEQARKIYRRHGAVDPMFGVSFAVLGKLQKKIRTDHALARALWDSRNADARNLATMIADPAQTTVSEVERWISVRGIGFHSGLLARTVIVRTPFAREKALEWITSSRPETAEVGWMVISAGAGKPEVFSEPDLLALLPIIEANTKSVPDAVRAAMNTAVIAIGLRSVTCRKAALAAAKRIGKIEVDHGETECKTPDAAAYILKTVAHRAAKARRV